MAKRRRRGRWWVFGNEVTASVPAHMTIGELRVGISRAVTDYLNQVGAGRGLESSFRVRQVAEPFDEPPLTETPGMLCRSVVNRDGYPGLVRFVRDVAREACRYPGVKARLVAKRRCR